MIVEIAIDVERTRNNSFQGAFPTDTKCGKCGMNARLGFVAFEPAGNSPNVCTLHPNEAGKMWLHDSCAVAVYFCEKCLEPTALYNQA